MLLFFTAILLGIIEGVTEFLPISSTGHLIIAQRLVNFNDAEEVFTVVIQLGAIGAVICYYRHDLIEKTKGLFAKAPQAIQFWKVLVIGTIPAGIVGLSIESRLGYLTQPVIIAWALIIGGIILWLVDRKPNITKGPPIIEKITLKQALLVGIGQCFALIPGVSRSGATIVSGLASGIDRPTATAFAFYLSIPVMVLASALKLIKNPGAVAEISGGPLILITGMVSAFVTSLLVITWLLRYISRHNYRPFAYYRIVFGILILIFIV